MSGVDSMESYKWLYNLIILNLYLFCVVSTQRPELILDEVLMDFKTKERELFERLDPSIRWYIVKRGVTIKDNVNIGFDTEFTKIGEGMNRIVSSQLAISCQTYIQIPRFERYKLSRLDELSNKLVKIKKNSSSFNYNKVEVSIQNCVGKIRGIKYGNYDSSQMILVECFKLVRGVSYFEDVEYTMFGFPRTSIQP